MAIDPRKLKPGELARLLNSTPLGEVISERQLHRHRTRAGFRVAADGDAGKVDLFRYVAWLATTRHEAIAAVESEAHDPNTVMAVHRKGYWLGERLLRAAMVTVAKGKG